MKKSLALFVLGILLFNFLAYPAYSTNNETNDSLKIKANLSSSSISKFKEDSNKLSTKEIKLPEGLSNFINFLFNFKENEILTLQKAIIIFSVWVMIVILIYLTLEIMPIFEKGFVTFLATLIIGLLISISGALTTIYSIFFSLLDTIEFLQEWPFFKVLVAFGIILIFFSGFLYLIKLIKNKEDIIIFRERGFRQGLSKN